MASKDSNFLEYVLTRLFTYDVAIIFPSSDLSNKFRFPKTRFSSMKHFIQDVSDRVEKEEDSSILVRRLERNARAVVAGGNWRNVICKTLSDGMVLFADFVPLSDFCFVF